MALRLQVACNDFAPGEQLGISGADAVFGAWEPTKAHLLVPPTGIDQPWTGAIPVPKGGDEFKLVRLRDGEVVAEPLAENRRWPSASLGSGFLLRMTFGDPKIGVEVSADYHESNARRTRKLEERQGSALQENVDKKGENAYYFAHTRKFEVPEDAKVITGPGLITGGQPVLLEAGSAMSPDAEEDRTVWLKDYSWADSKGKVKVYVPVPEGLLPADGAEEIAEVDWQPMQVDLSIKAKLRHRLKIEKLNGELKVEECSIRVEAAKNRIVLQLAKKRDTTWYNLTKK